MKENVNDEKIENFINLDNQFWKDRAEGKIKDSYNFKTTEINSLIEFRTED